jgi:hypothetical protein
VTAPELTSIPARERGHFPATSGDFNMATDSEQVESGTWYRADRCLVCALFRDTLLRSQSQTRRKIVGAGVIPQPGATYTTPSEDMQHRNSASGRCARDDSGPADQIPPFILPPTGPVASWHAFNRDHVLTLSRYKQSRRCRPGRQPTSPGRCPPSGSASRSCRRRTRYSDGC